MAAPSSLPPQLSLGLVRSRLSIAASKPYVEYFLGQETLQNDRKEARRKLGRSGRVMEDTGSSSDSDDSSGWDLLQQIPPAEGVRRVTFSTGGAADQQQPQPDQPQPVTPQLARLWRGAAASVCAGQRLQSLERHAAELKQRQEVHTELKAWVELALSAQHQDIFLDHEQDGPDTTDAAQTHTTLQKHNHHHHHRGDHHQHQQQQPEGQQVGQQQHEVGQQQRRSHHRSRRSHHRHHRSGSGSVSSVVPDPGAAAEQSTEAAVQTAIPAAAEPGGEAVQQAEQTTGLTATAPMQLHQDAEQWQQFNVAEQQLIQQLQQDQHMLLEQLQLAYQQIALLTAAQQTQGPPALDDVDAYHHSRVSCSLQQGSGPVEHPDIVLRPSPETQVLVISRSSNTVGNSPEQPSFDTGSLVTDICNQSEQQQEEQQQQQQSEPANAGVSAPRCSDSSTQRRSSTSSTPRSRLATNMGSTGVQPSSGPKTPRAASTKAAKAQGAAPRVSSAAAHEAAAGPAKLTPRQAAKSTSRPSISMPQGRGLTLEQQQALVQRLQQAEGVMELLQRDLQTSVEAQTQLQQQLQQQAQQAEPSCGARQLPDSDQHSSLQQEQEQQLQPAGQDSAGACQSQHLQELRGQEALLDVGVQCGDEASSGPSSSEELVQALQQQLQDQLLEVSTARTQLCELQQADEAQKQQVAQLREQLQHHRQQEQLYMQRMQSLQQELAETTDRLISSQQEYQKLMDNTEQRQQQHLRQQGEVRECMLQQPAAADNSGCCVHEARCQQLQSMLHALLLQMQQQEARPCSKLYSTTTDISCMRPQTAAVYSPLKVRATWQHRPVEMRTWLYPPLQPTRPATAAISQSAQMPAGALSDRSHFRSQPTHWDRSQASGALTTRCGSATPQSLQGLQECLLQPGECKLRPLTYRGPDREAAAALGTAAASSRRRLSADAERGLLASLRVAPCSAGRLTTLGKGAPSQQQTSSGSEPADALRAADAANSVAASVANSPRRRAGNRAAGLAASASSGDSCAAQGGASSPRRSPEGGRRCLGSIPRLVLSALH